MADMYVMFALILCVSGCFGLLHGQKLDPGNQYRQSQDLVTFVDQKIEGIERLLAVKDERVDRLESILTNQKTEISQLKRGMSSLEQEMLHKDGIVDRLVNRVIDLEMIVMMDPITQEPVSQQYMKLNTDSTILLDDVLTKLQSPINETTSFRRQSNKSSLPANETRQPKRSRPPSGDERLTHSAASQQSIYQPVNVSRAAFLRFQQKSIDPSSQTPNQHVAFHVALSRDKAYHEDNTIVYDNVKLDHGNGYNPAGGVYTAPESGTYVFTWTSLCYGNQQFQTVLVVNGAYMGSSWTDAEVVNDVHQTTAVVVITVTQGDHVFIRMGSTYGHGNILSRTDFGESTFSGWKLD